MYGNARVGSRTKIWHPEKSVLCYCDIGDDCVIHAMVWIGDNVKIGNRCKVQAFAFIPDGVTIEDDCFIGPRVTFTNDKNPPSGQWSKTLVKKGTRIGAGAVILPGITLGEGCVIGAGAVVTKSVPAHEVWVGNPAKAIVHYYPTPDQMDPYHPDVNKCPIHAEGLEGMGYACTCKKPCPVHSDHLVDPVVSGDKCTCK